AGGGVGVAGACALAPAPGWSTGGAAVAVLAEAGAEVELDVAGAGELGSGLSEPPALVARGGLLRNLLARTRTSCRQYHAATATAAISRIRITFRPRWLGVSSSSK